jgi:Fur family ferric uptake transcriptional regulator
MEDIEKTLKSYKIKVTDQRKKIYKVIANSKDHPDADEIHHRVKKYDKSIGLATVYRTISIFEQEGLLKRIQLDHNKKARFETKHKKEHHHHLIDINNGNVIEFASNEFEKLKDKIATELGYEVVDHKFELYCIKKDN